MPLFSNQQFAGGVYEPAGLQTSTPSISIQTPRGKSTPEEEPTETKNPSKSTGNSGASSGKTAGESNSSSLVQTKNKSAPNAKSAAIAAGAEAGESTGTGKSSTSRSTSAAPKEASVSTPHEVSLTPQNLQGILTGKSNLGSSVPSKSSGKPNAADPNSIINAMSTPEKPLPKAPTPWYDQVGHTLTNAWHDFEGITAQDMGSPNKYSPHLTGNLNGPGNFFGFKNYTPPAKGKSGTGGSIPASLNTLTPSQQYAKDNAGVLSKSQFNADMQNKGWMPSPNDWETLNDTANAPMESFGRVPSESSESESWPTELEQNFGRFVHTAASDDEG